MALPQSETYTVEDIYALPEGQRAELIDGRIYNMAPPVRVHQHLVMNLSAAIHAYIKAKGGDCLVYPAPFAVFLNEDDRNYVEPDISVICDQGKLDEKRLSLSQPSRWTMALNCLSTARPGCVNTGLSIL